MIGASRLLDNKKGTITDRSTGLIWLKNASPTEKRSWNDFGYDDGTLETPPEIAGGLAVSLGGCPRTENLLRKAG